MNSVTHQSALLGILRPLLIVLAGAALACDRTVALSSESDDAVGPVRQLHSAEGDVMPSRDRLNAITRLAHSENDSLRRRAVLALSREESDTARFVDAWMLSPYSQGHLPLRIRGKATLPRLLHYLSDARYRPQALEAIADVAHVSRKDIDELNAKFASVARDPILERVLTLLSAAAGDGKSLRRLAPEDLASEEDRRLLVPMCLVAAAFQPTRQYGLIAARIRLRQLVVGLHGTPDRDTVETGFSFLRVMATAARDESLAKEDIALIDGLREQCRGRPFATVEPEIRMILWMGGGRQKAALDQALELMGDDEPEYGMRFHRACILRFGDRILPLSDIPLLCERASDGNVAVQVRVGAIRLLSFLGTADHRAHQVLIQILESKDSRLRHETAQAMGMCVDSDNLTKSVKDRLARETSSTVRHELEKTLTLLEAF